MPTKSLDRLLFAQGGLCFFCREPLAKEDASIEHLVARVNGGNGAEENCVVCCTTINAYLGSMSVKQKMAVILNQKGEFRCPKAVQKPLSKPLHSGVASKALEDEVELVIANLQQRGPARPKSIKTLLSTIRSLFQKGLAEDQLASLVQRLQERGVITVEGTKVTYAG